jgi:hypothetical protein
VIVVVGAPGSGEYGDEFRHAATLWKTAASKAEAEITVIGEGSHHKETDRERLRSAVGESRSSSLEPLWLVLIGHGTYDGREAKFNMRGPDVSDTELADWLKSIERPLIVVNGFSASGPFLNRLSAKNRIVVTATRSGDEQNYSRFGEYFAEAIGDLKADLDKDGQVSVLEAFLAASRGVEEFYRSKSRLATEHALLDDNGDRLGTPAAWFEGLRVVKRAKDRAEPDGLRAHQVHLIMNDRERNMPPELRQKRDRLELEVAALRAKKDKLSEDDYYKQLETIMTELAQVYSEAKMLP